jgi:purine-binding chemotaxis protein CheW
VVPATSDETADEFISFLLESEWYAAPIHSVREILKVPPLTEVPRAPEGLLGVMNLRGDVLPVNDIKVRLKLVDSVPRYASPEVGPSALSPQARILVIHTTPWVAGVLVDRVGGVVRLKRSLIEAPPPGVAEDRDLVTGLGRQRDQLFILISLEQALR